MHTWQGKAGQDRAGQRDNWAQHACWPGYIAAACKAKQDMANIQQSRVAAEKHG